MRMMRSMKTVSEIIDGLGGNSEFAQICGWTKNPNQRGADIRRRASIPVGYWKRVVAAAEERGISLDYEELVEIHTDETPPAL